MMPILVLGSLIMRTLRESQYSWWSSRAYKLTLFSIARGATHVPAFGSFFSLSFVVFIFFLLLFLLLTRRYSKKMIAWSDGNGLFLFPFFTTFFKYLTFVVYNKTIYNAKRVMVRWIVQMGMNVGRMTITRMLLGDQVKVIVLGDQVFFFGTQADRPQSM